MIERTIYLAGPITGLTFETATDWREYASKKFPDWIKPLSPLRGKSYLKGMVDERNTIADHYMNKILSTPRGITTRDRNDVMRSDAVLVNFMGASRVSIGTVVEVGWADAYRKPLIIVMDKDNLHWHSIVRECAGYITSDLDEAIDVASQILGTGF
jgi:nucleoside 2-deoxyribosyltransferase